MITVSVLKGLSELQWLTSIPSEIRKPTWNQKIYGFWMILGGMEVIINFVCIRLLIEVKFKDST